MNLIRTLTTWLVELMREMDRARAVMHGEAQPKAARTRTGSDPQ